MKHLIVLLVIVLLSGCEKDQCYECIATDGMFYERYVVCGEMSKREAERDYRPIYVSDDYTVNCK